MYSIQNLTQVMLKEKQVGQHKKLLCALMICSVCLLNSCSIFYSYTKSKCTLYFQSQPNTNGGEPLKIRVLYLSANTKFNSSDFYTLQNSIDTVLGEELLRTDEFFLRQGKKTETLTVEKADAIQYIGVIAEYRQIDKIAWRILLPLKATNNQPRLLWWQGEPKESEYKILADSDGIHISKVH